MHSNPINLLKSIIFGFLIFFSLQLCAQSDSTLLNFGQLTEQQRRTFIDRFSQEWENMDVKVAKTLALKVLTQACVLKDTISIEQLYHQLGQLSRFKIAYDSSHMYYQQALAMAKHRHSFIGEAEHLNGLGLLYRQQGQLKQAIVSSLDALNASEKGHDKIIASDAFFNIGYVFNMLNNYDTALLYHEKALAIRIALKDSARIAASYNGIGLVLMKKENYDEARKLYLKAVAMINKDMNKRLLSMVYNNLGVTHENQGRYEEGRRYYFQSLELKEKMNDLRGMASTYGNLGDNFREVHKPDEAIRYAMLSRSMSEETKSLDYLIISYKLLSYAYEEKGDFKQSLGAFRIYKNLQDSLYNENKVKQINELITQHTLEKKKEEIERLSKDNLLAKVEAKDNRNIAIVIGISSVTIIILILVIYYNRNRYQKKIQAFNLKQTLRQERDRIARDLHDSLGGQLSSISMGLNSLTKDSKGTTQVIQDMADQALGELRNALWVMEKEYVSVAEVEQRINNLFWQYRKMETPIDLQIKTDNYLSDHYLSSLEAGHLYRIIQEATNNSVKHSKASLFQIDIEKVQQRIQVIIADNGIGMEMWPVQESGHYGLRNMQVRAKQIKANFAVESSVGKGMVIRLTIPISQEAPKRRLAMHG